MMRGFKIGRMFGINIRIDWSWLLIFALVTWNLSASFGNLHPDWSQTLRWGLATTAALLFFASVLAHELAHSIIARSRGVPVRSITLFLFGGVSNIQREPESPLSELLFTIVGPLTSLFLGALFLILGSINLTTGPLDLSNPTQIAGELDPTSTILLWLGSINIVVGVFNLIPGFPLDGGRIVRSILWMITDNLRQATRWASWIGQGIAWLMIFTGISMIFGARIPFFGTGTINGLWLAFIGWFLNSASGQSYQQVVVRDILEDIPVTRLVRSDVQSVSPEITVDSLVHDYIMRSDEDAFPVVRDDRLVGLVTIDEVKQLDRDQWSTTHVADILVPEGNLNTISTDMDAAEAFEKLQTQRENRLPVLDGESLVGLLSRRDFIRWLQLQSQLQ